MKSPDLGRLFKRATFQELSKIYQQQKKWKEAERILLEPYFENLDNLGALR